jgi:hypothetical protein
MATDTAHVDADRLCLINTARSSSQCRFALSILLEAPVNAAEGSSGELPEFQNRESNSDQIIEEVGHDFLSNFVQLTELERNAIDSTVRTNLDSSNTTSIETEAFTSPPQLLLGFPAVPFFS